MEVIFVFESVGLLSYHIHKTSLKRGNSYIKSPEWNGKNGKDLKK